MEEHKGQVDSLNAIGKLGTEDASAVLQKAAQRAVELLGMNSVDSPAVVPASVRSNQNQGRLDPAALQVVQIYNWLDQIMGGELEVMKAWWHSTNKALEATPNELARSEAGREMIIAYLEAMSTRR